jgi:hypothetical protein
MEKTYKPFILCSQRIPAFVAPLGICTKNFHFSFISIGGAPPAPLNWNFQFGFYLFHQVPGDQEGLFKLAIQLRKFLFITL